MSSTEKAPRVVGVVDYSVNVSGSHPDADADDNWYGEEVATREEALALRDKYMQSKDPSDRYIWIVGPDFEEVTRIPGRRFKSSAEADVADRQAERRERAMEAGMLHGIDAYNDEMGF